MSVPRSFILLFVDSIDRRQLSSSSSSLKRFSILLLNIIINAASIIPDASLDLTRKKFENLETHYVIPHSSFCALF